MASSHIMIRGSAMVTFRNTVLLLTTARQGPHKPPKLLPIIIRKVAVPCPTVRQVTPRTRTKTSTAAIAIKQIILKRHTFTPTMITGSGTMPVATIPTIISTDLGSTGAFPA